MHPCLRRPWAPRNGGEVVFFLPCMHAHALHVTLLENFGGRGPQVYDICPLCKAKLAEARSHSFWQGVAFTLRRVIMKWCDEWEVSSMGVWDLCNTQKNMEI